MAVVSDDAIDIEKLGWALMAHGLQLLPRPHDESLLAERASEPTTERAARHAFMLKAAVLTLINFGARADQPPNDAAAHVARTRR